MFSNLFSKLQRNLKEKWETTKHKKCQTFETQLSENRVNNAMPIHDSPGRVAGRGCTRKQTYKHTHKNGQFLISILGDLYA